MATKVMMPKLSDTMDEGKILKWLRKEGEQVKQGEPLVEIESDKADMELEAYDSGVLRKIIVPDGGKAPIGAVIAVIGSKDEDISSVLSEVPASSKAQPSPAPMPKPQEKAQPAPVQTPQRQPSGPPLAARPAPSPTDGRLKASPLARRIAQEKGISLASIHGSGPQGRIIRRDLEGLTFRPSTGPAQPIVPGTSEEVALSSIRKTIAKRMAESKATAPHFYVTVEIDMEPAMAFRAQILAATSLKISYTDLIIKASATALMQHPAVNGSFLGESARHHHYVHIGVAVALEQGLVTPVIRNCEQKRIDQINAELHDLVDRARNRKLKPDEYQGSTFTISNLGMFDVDDFVAIINPPEGAILAIGSILEKPVVRDGAIAIGHTMKVTLSSDHRIIDGAVAARFLQDLKKYLQNPAALTV
jgi:pyruvate dehydrogenase E2 component (dihydrolipoamide acetyltransferase)